MDSKTRAELNSLSKEVFGASSRWSKLVNNGYSKLLTEKVTEYVPSDTEGGEGTTREVDVPVKLPNGSLQYVTERHTVESVRELMLEMKARREAFLAQIERERQEAEAKKAQEELNKKVGQELTGSALA